tara:strand:+ start:449 stop:1195 length:747 start_codon:yes stop_codon:yes gene_type:complete
MFTLKWTEEVLKETKKLTKLLVDICHSQILHNDNNHHPMDMIGTAECWDAPDGEKDLQFKIIHEAGISDKDSILDIGCGNADFYRYLKTQRWDGHYLGIDPGECILSVDESINTLRCTIEDLDETKYDWVIANAIFDLTLVSPVVTTPTTNVDRFNPEFGPNKSKAWINIVCNLISEENSLRIIDNMISRANKGVVFNMIQVSHHMGHETDMKSYWIYNKLLKYNHNGIKIIEDYMKNDREFMVYFYV